MVVIQGKFALPLIPVLGYYLSQIYSTNYAIHRGKDVAVNTTVGQLADLVQGKVEGNESLEIAAARPLVDARAGDISFVEQEKFLPQFNASPACVAVVGLKISALPGKTLIQVADPLSAFIQIVKHLHGRPDRKPGGIDPRASIHPTATLGAEVTVEPFACIGENTILGARCRIYSGVSIGRDCWIGDDAVLYPNVVLYDGTKVGPRTILHAGVVLGADGFGYRFQEGRHAKVPQLGTVEIGADVEIGAGTKIDRATFGATVVGDGTKIDNLVQIGHNCRIGRHNLIVSQVGIGGSSTTGDYVVMAGQVGIADHVEIGAGAVVGAKAGVYKDIPAGQKMLGIPATPERDQKRLLLSLDKLPDMIKDVREIKKRLDARDVLPKAG